MQQIIDDKNQLKEVFKQAFAELLQERRDLLYDVFTEALEDIALANAIKEGEETEIVSREQVFKILESESWKLNLEVALREIPDPSETNLLKSVSRQRYNKLRK